MARVPADKPLAILYEDEALFVVDKPAGLPSVPSPGVTGPTCAGLAQRTCRGALAVHRLDRETSGTMIFAKDEETRGELERSFRARAVRKVYLALVRGTPRPKKGSLRFPITKSDSRARVARHGQEAITEYEVIEELGLASLVEARPVTGRYNQIRLHFAHLGHPLVGERKYARGRQDRVGFRRVALHARSVSFPHPAGAEVTVEAPVPEDMRKLLASLGSRTGIEAG